MKRKIFCKLAVLILSVLCISCQGVFNNKNNKEDFVVVTGYVGDSVSLSAYPANSKFYYQLLAYEKDNEAGGTTNGVVQDNGLYTIALKKGKVWIIRAVGFSDENKTINSIYGEVEVDLTAEYDSSAQNILLNDIYTGNGTISLPLYVDSSIISKCIVSLYKEDSLKKSETINFTSPVNEYLINITEIAGGIYDAVFDFYSSYGVKHYSRHERVYVIPGITTDIWSNEGPYINTTLYDVPCLYINKEVVQKYHTKNIYVSGDGDDSNSGSYYSPLQTLQQAVDLAAELNDESSTYKIQMKDNGFTLTGGRSDSVVCVDSDTVLNLDFETSDILRVDSYYTGNRFIYVGDKANVTLSSLDIYGFGNSGASPLNGAVLYSEGTVVLDSVSISSNSAFPSGGGLYLKGGICTLTGTTIIENNSAGTGDDVYLENGAVLALNGVSRVGGEYTIGTIFIADSGKIELLSNSCIITDVIIVTEEAASNGPVIYVGKEGYYYSDPMRINWNATEIGAPIIEGKDITLTEELLSYFQLVDSMGNISNEYAIVLDSSRNQGVLASKSGIDINNPFGNQVVFQINETTYELDENYEFTGEHNIKIGVKINRTNYDSGALATVLEDFTMQIYYEGHLVATTNDPVYEVNPNWIGGTYTVIVSGKYMGVNYDKTFEISIIEPGI